MERLFERARLAYQNKDYKKAGNLYKLAGERYGKEIVDFNLKLCAELEKHNSTFKSKYSGSLNKIVDKIYVVNLERDLSKRLAVCKHLRDHGLEFELFKATNGYEGEALKQYEDYVLRGVGNLRRYPEFNKLENHIGRRFINSAGAIGYIFTYIRLFEAAKRQGHKRILVLEDDVMLCSDFSQKALELFERVPNDWLIVHLGASQYNWDSVDDNTASVAGFYNARRLDTCGSFAMAVDLTILEDLVPALKAFDAPFDHLPIGEIYEKNINRCLVAYPNIVIPDVSESTIREGRCQDSHSRKMRWNLENFKFPREKPILNCIVSDETNLRYFQNFSNPEEQPFILRLFINSEDGPRPVHTKELIGLDINQASGFDGSLLTLPTADISVVLKPGYILSEEDVKNFIEDKLLEGKKSFDQFDEISCEYKLGVSGLVSIIITTFKRPKHLGEALKSVASQDYEKKEIIVVCDNGNGSEFNRETEAVFKDVQKSFPDVKMTLIFHQKNRNAAAARNTGFLQSSGEYICFLDDDDLYLPGRLRESIKALEEKGQRYGAIYCGFLGWNSPENNLNRYMEGDLTKAILSLDYTRHYMCTNTVTYKRESIASINGFDETYRRHQDLEFNLRFFQKFEICSLKKALVRLRPEPTSIDNSVFNYEMLVLKEKFLGQFIHLAGDDKELIENIYSKHWSEVMRYIKDKDTFIDAVSSDIDSGRVQVLLKCLELKNEVS